jgi:hypothetical protein
MHARSFHTREGCTRLQARAMPVLECTRACTGHTRSTRAARALLLLRRGSGSALTT